MRVYSRLDKKDGDLVSIGTDWHSDNFTIDTYLGVDTSRSKIKVV